MTEQIKSYQYIKSYDMLIAKICELEKEILGNVHLSVFQKQTKIAWREALVWAITKEEHAWRKALNEVRYRVNDGKSSGREDKSE